MKLYEVLGITHKEWEKLLFSRNMNPREFIFYCIEMLEQSDHEEANKFKENLSKLV